ncbi:hypothetical protein [Cryobacterium aureum]|uniref:hypothetical protein n=1 Tax=Cryobacterium aureum TaxID=995037 RepID=UPI000CF4FE0D|nr:hypothetical protein [Cryobacterium aureum]
MESENANTATSARAALAAIATDRQRLGLRLKSQTWWTAPAQALAIAAFIASPAAGITVGMTMVAGAASLALFGIDHLVRKQMRLLKLPGPAGPVSLMIIIVLCVVMLGAFVLSIVFEVTDQRAWIVLTTAVVFVVALISSALYDLANARELLRGC